jgi:uncharacterized repeat protein (TIGR01451 family)
LPVLKRHGSAGATIAVKNYIGFITTSDPGGRWADVPEIHCWLTGGSGSCSAESTNYGLIGRQMARIRRADLDIVDAIWVNSCSNLNEPNEIRRQDILFSGRDPFAVDYYASEFLLGPLVQQYSSSCWMHPDYRQSIASYHGGIFRNVDLRNVARLRAEGITNTINLTDTLTRDQELAQFNVYVADASGATTPTLTLLAPNGGETWTVGAQQQIRWSGNDLAGNVKLEYSTNSFTSAKVITSSTSNTGVFTWTIPNDLSSNALVRISSTLSGTISDMSNAVFSIVGPHVFEESFKQASHTRLQSGESVTYTIVLYEAISATLTVTDVVPAPLTYVPGSAQIEPAWKGPLVIADGIRWTGTVTGLQPVTITLRAQSPMTTTAWTITNRAQIACNGAAPVERTAVSFLNGSSVYLPLVCRNP